MEKKEYKSPKIEVLEIETEDVISTSKVSLDRNDNKWNVGEQASSASTRTNFYDRYND